MTLIRTVDAVRQDLSGRGFAWIPRDAWSVDPHLERAWNRLAADWDRLEPDRYLRSGATFRRRRYGRYWWGPGGEELLPLPHGPYFQPEEENAYAGGVVREFAPLLPDTVANPFLHAVVRSTFACLPVAAGRREHAWEVRVHQIRILASPEQPGFPAPEGVHQDGTDFLTLHLVRRRNVAGAESRVYDLGRNPIWRDTLREPLDSLILEDWRVLHGASPAYSADGRTPGTRDILGVDFIYSPTLERPAGGE